MIDYLRERNSEAIMFLQDDKFIECNDKTAEIFGCTHSDLINKEPWRFSPDKQPDGMSSRDAALEKIHAALNGENQQFTWMHMRYDGTPFFAQVTLKKVQYDNAFLIEAVVRDLCKSMNLEEQQNCKRQMDSVRTLLHSLDHNLRNRLQESLLAATMLYGTIDEKSQKVLQLLIVSLRKSMDNINEVSKTCEVLDVFNLKTMCQKIFV